MCMEKLEAIVETGTHSLSASLKFNDDLLTTTGKTVDEILSSPHEQFKISIDCNLVAMK